MSIYHMISGDFKGDQLHPSQANPNDPEPYIYAGPMEECLPYVMPNGTRCFHDRLPDKSAIFVVLPDRDAFLEQSVDATLYKLPEENFKPHPKKEFQYISTIPVKKEDMVAVKHLKTIEDVMEMGVQFLCVADKIPKDQIYDFTQDIINDPEYPNNIIGLIQEGVLIHENAQANIKPHPFLSLDTKTGAPENSPVTKFLTGTNVSAPLKSAKPLQSQNKKAPKL